MESLESINRQLRDLYGTDIVTNQSIWRVVFSEDQLEKRLKYNTDAGIQLLTPVVVEVPKYRQYIQNKYVLERLTLIPEMHLELTTEKISYEPIFVFEHAVTHEPLPPNIQAAKFVIDTLYAVAGKSSLAKYKDPGETREQTEERIKNLQSELFGNETEVGDALAYKEAIVVPRNYGDR